MVVLYQLDCLLKWQNYSLVIWDMYIYPPPFRGIKMPKMLCKLYCRITL